MSLQNERKYYVYVFYVVENNKVFYVGKGNGKRYLTKNRPENIKFMEFINNNECKSKIIKSNLTEDEAFDLEIETIAYYRKNGHPLVNVLDGGKNPPNLKGKVMTDEQKQKISNSHKLRYAKNPKLREVNSERLKEFLRTEKGIAFIEKSLISRRSDEFKKAQSIRSKKANNTKEYKEKQSAIVKEMWKSKEYAEKHIGKNNHSARSIKQYTLDGIFLKEFDTVTQASVETGVSASKISAVANGKRKSAGGFIWKSDKESRKRIKKNSISKPVNCLPIIQYDMNGNFVREYESVAEATRFNNFEHRTNIIANLKGRTKSAYGFIWKYKHGNTVPSQEGHS